MNSLSKLVLAVIALLHLDPHKIKESSIVDLYEKYRNVVAKHSKTINFASNSEFQDAIGQLEVSGLIQYTSRKGKKLLSLCASAVEILDLLKGSPLLASIIEYGIV